MDVSELSSFHDHLQPITVIKIWNEQIHAAGVPRRLGSSVFNAKPWFLKTTHPTPRKSLAILKNLEWSTVIKHVLVPTLRHLRCHKLIKMASESFYTWHRYSIFKWWKWNNISACVEHKSWSSSRTGPSAFILHRLQGWSSICEKGETVCISTKMQNASQATIAPKRYARKHHTIHYTYPTCKYTIYEKFHMSSDLPFWPCLQIAA